MANLAIWRGVIARILRGSRIPRLYVRPKTRAAFFYHPPYCRRARTAPASGKGTTDAPRSGGISDERSACRWQEIVLTQGGDNRLEQPTAPSHRPPVPSGAAFVPPCALDIPRTFCSYETYAVRIYARQYHAHQHNHINCRQYEYVAPRRECVVRALLDVWQPPRQTSPLRPPRHRNPIC